MGFRSELYTGEQKPRGRKRKYDGKVSFTDLSRFTAFEAVQPNLDLYTQRVWHVISRQCQFDCPQPRKGGDEPAAFGEGARALLNGIRQATGA